MNKDLEENAKKLEAKSTKILEFLVKLLEEDHYSGIEEAEEGMRVLGHALIRLTTATFQSQQDYEKYLDSFVEIAKHAPVLSHPPS